MSRQNDVKRVSQMYRKGTYQVSRMAGSGAWGRLLGAMFCTVCVVGGANADDNNVTAKTWDVSLGAGTMARPTFSGSDRYTIAPLPLINIKWNDMVSLGYEGLSLYWHHDNFRIGTGLVIDPGRDTSHVNTISFTTGDERLKGLGKIDLSPGLKVFASYQLSSINFMVSGVKYEGSQNKGIVVNFGASAPLQLGSGLTLTPHAGANWADSKYMQTYYGVTAQQSSKSAFAEFDTKAGMRDVNGGITLTYAFNRHWFTSTDFTATQLLGDAKKSPISFSDTGMMVMTAVGYHF